jgi:hypothetical protein
MSIDLCSMCDKRVDTDKQDAYVGGICVCERCHEDISEASGLMDSAPIHTTICGEKWLSGSDPFCDTCNNTRVIASCGACPQCVPDRKAALDKLTALSQQLGMYDDQAVDKG